MSYIKTVLLVVVLTIGIFPGCGGDPEECVRTSPRYFDIFGIEVQHASGNAFSFQILPSGSSLLYENYRGLHVLPNVNLYGSASPEKSFLSELFKGKSLWAGDFIPGDQGSETEVLSDIDVVTINEFNDTYPAGSSIKDIIEVWVGESLVNLEEFINSKNSSLVQLEDLPYVLRPSVSPSTDIPFQVRITISFENGEAYEAVSGELNILN